VALGVSRPATGCGDSEYSAHPVQYEGTLGSHVNHFRAGNRLFVAAERAGWIKSIGLGDFG
jgi:hypothetical protein